MALIANEGGKADGQIFNIGCPRNNCSIRELAEILLDEMKKIPALAAEAERAKIVSTTAEVYYGSDYDDLNNRVPSVEKIERLLGWRPSTSLRDTLRLTLEAAGAAGPVTASRDESEAPQPLPPVGKKRRRNP
jgi:nucleoside-diphosphate-sugar epimerase